MILSSTNLLPQGLRSLSYHNWPSFSVDKLKDEFAFLEVYLLKNKNDFLTQENKENHLFYFFYNFSLSMLLAQRREFTIVLTSEKMKEGFHFHACDKTINNWIWGVKVPPNAPTIAEMDFSLEELEFQMKSHYIKDVDVSDRTGTIPSLYFSGFVVAFLLWEQSRTKGLFGTNVLTTQMIVDEQQQPVDFVGTGRRFSSNLIVPNQTFHFSNQGDSNDNQSI